MNIVVTGSNGFIGKHLCRRLRSEGHKIRSCDIVNGVRDCDFLPNYHAKTDFIFHLASPVGCRKVMLEQGVYSNIIRGAAAAIECADRLGAKLIAFSSAEAEYAFRTSGKRSEYPKGKRMLEMMCMNSDLDVSLIRPHNVIGPRQNQDAGFVVPRFIQAKLEGKPLPVFGDGNQQRIFTSVHDVVDFCELLLTKNLNGKHLFNIGNDQNIVSINELACMVGGEIQHVSGAESYGIESYEDMPSRNKENMSWAVVNGWKPTRLLPDILKEIEDEYRNDRA